MPNNKHAKEDLSLVWTELLVAAATIACAALLLLALSKTDFAAWMFLVILSVIGLVACVIFSVKARKAYLSASANGKPKRALVLAFLIMGITAVAFLTFFLITLIRFLI